MATLLTNATVTSGGGLKSLRDRFWKLRGAVDAQLPSARARTSVREVVLLSSASRAGSTLVAEILRQSSRLLHLMGEVTPFLAMRGHSFPTSGTGSDALHGDYSRQELADVASALISDCGQPTTQIRSDRDIWNFGVHLASRLLLQWPEHSHQLDLERVVACVGDCLRALTRRYGWRPGVFEDGATFHALFLQRLRQRYPWLDPWRYDLDADFAGRFGPIPRRRLGPPEYLTLEETPFVTIGPWTPADEECLATMPLIIKTPSNAYRFAYIQALFPCARIRIVHLMRNPAASINGLYDGWRHPGFFSHIVPEQLEISGYSDVFTEWGKRWWKFDLPPGWRSLVRRPLEEVCAAQWVAANRAVLQHTRDAEAEQLLRIRFEDVGAGTDQRILTFQRLMWWLTGDLPDERMGSALLRTLPPVMATSPPGRGRWRQRAALLGPVLAGADVRDVAGRLGYGSDRSAWD